MELLTMKMDIDFLSANGMAQMILRNMFLNTPDAQNQIVSMLFVMRRFEMENLSMTLNLK